MPPSGSSSRRIRTTGLRRGERFHHQRLLDAGVRILEYSTTVHAKAFVRDGEDVLAGTCNLEAWSLKRFFEIDVRVQSPELARQFADDFFVLADEVSGPGSVPVGVEGAREVGRVCGVVTVPLEQGCARFVAQSAARGTFTPDEAGGRDQPSVAAPQAPAPFRRDAS